MNDSLNTSQLPSNPIASKICKNCKKEKLISSFCKCSANEDKLSTWCKDCFKIFQHKYHCEHKNIPSYRERKRKNERKYNKTHKEIRKLYVKNNPYRIKNIYKKHSQTPKARMRNKLYREKINVRLACNLRSRIRSAMLNICKSQHTMELIGCTIEDLRNHLEKLFQKGMTWENYGYGNNKWHIDHIIPCSFFILSDPVEQKQCFHYTNLQPMWQFDNISKHDNINSNSKYFYP